MFHLPIERDSESIQGKTSLFLLTPRFNAGIEAAPQLMGFSPTLSILFAQFTNVGLKPEGWVAASHPRHKWRG